MNSLVRYQVLATSVDVQLKNPSSNSQPADPAQAGIQTRIPDAGLFAMSRAAFVAAVHLCPLALEFFRIQW